MNTKVGNREREADLCENFEDLKNITYDEYDPEQEEQYDIQQYINGCKERQDDYMSLVREFTC